MRTHIRHTRILLAPFCGVVIWAAHFAAMYFAQTTYCVFASEPANSMPLRLIGAALTVAAVAALVGSGMWLLSEDRQNGVIDAELPAFKRVVVIATGALAMLAISWSLVPLLLLPACGFAGT